MPKLPRRQLLAAAAALFAPLTPEAEAGAEGEGADALDEGTTGPRTEHFELARPVFHLPDLHPAHDGLTIGQLSDIHVGKNTPDGRVLAAVRALNRAKPDLVLLTGDYVTRRGDPLERVAQLLQGIEAPVVAVLGNHDHWVDARELRRLLEGIGCAVLQNRHTLLELRGAPLCVLGIDDSRTGHDDVEATFKGAPQSGSRVVATHIPVTAEALPAFGNLVQFSGHTHGGHVHLGALTEALFARAGQPYVRGGYTVRGNQLYVNRGLGFGRGGPVVRVRSEPEVTLATLRRGEGPLPASET